mmetsp:Transcript_82790/g.222057  ORF Transcript_82790/g.222057 Transcript_82790/m.222057 type:complete len:202 (-) Transcript_82790:244-849(-)
MPTWPANCGPVCARWAAHWKASSKPRLPSNMCSPTRASCSAGQGACLRSGGRPCGAFSRARGRSTSSTPCPSPRTPSRATKSRFRLRRTCGWSAAKMACWMPLGEAALHCSSHTGCGAARGPRSGRRTGWRGCRSTLLRPCLTSWHRSFARLSWLLTLPNDRISSSLPPSWMDETSREKLGVTQQLVKLACNFMTEPGADS